MNLLEKIFEDDGLVKKLKIGAYALMVVLVVMDLFIHRHHVYFFWDRVPGFSAVLGFVSCVLLIFAAGAFGKHLVRRGEDYYDND